MATPELRLAVRAVALDPADRVLLVRFTSPWTGESWWATVGGGVAEGETHEEALRRELREEGGIEAGDLGPRIWTREHIYEWGDRLIRQVESYHLIRVGSDQIAPHFSPEQLAAEGVDEVRWWSLAELESSEETFAPSRLAELLRSLLEHGPPPETVDVGV